MEFRGMMGGFYRISEWIMRLSVINILWVICAIPFFLLGLVLLQSQTGDQVVQTLFLMAVVSPFTIFPSTAAMFTVARKWLTGEEDVPLLKTFFRGYKENFLQSMLGGFIYILLGVILYTNFRFYGSQTGVFGVLRFLVLSLTVVLIISLFHFFSIMTHLHMKWFQIVKNAILITIGNPIRSLSMMVLNVIILYVSFAIFTFLIPFFMGSFIAIVSFWHFNLIFGKLQEKQQEIADQDEEEADRKQGGAEQESETRIERGQRPSESGAIEEGDNQGKNGKP
ncbi:YesL family protein [Paenibacillus naphthalenovorans]|uniref:YesL family protein n=1 Tax=Paenibacillus naphthalenovorans TaxID=162209 RepID=UPI003D28D9E3